MVICLDKAQYIYQHTIILIGDIMKRLYAILGVSTTLWAVLLIVFLLIGLGIGYMIPRPTPAGPSVTTTITVPGALQTTIYTVTAPGGVAGLPKEIPIGVLDALSGAFASYGIRGQTAAKLAERDINDFVKKLGLDVRFVFYYEDYATKPDIALQKVQALYAKGVKVIIGGLISGAVKQIAPYAEANKIVVITGTSTAPRAVVAPPGGYVFRTLPTVEAEGIGVVALMLELGIKSAIIVTPEETYALSFRDAFLKVSKERGINIVLDLTYPVDTKDFNPLLDQMERAARPLIDRREPFAVIANVWEDHAAVMLTQASARKSPLLGVLWLTSDTVPLSTIVLEQAKGEAEKVRLIGPLFTGAVSKVADHVREYVKSMLGQEPDIYALAEYDAAWIAALAILLAGKYDGEAIKNAVPLAASIYWGATGNIEFNNNGDRSYADMILYGVFNGTWKEVAIYRVLENKIYWLVSPQALKP